jgi:hypothetical protein
MFTRFLLLTEVNIVSEALCFEETEYDGQYPM